MTPPTPPVTTPPPGVKPSLWTLAWRQTLRDVRAGELRLWVLALALAVGALSAVALFADRLERGLARDARALLGGDLVISADEPVPAKVLAEAQRLGLKTVATTAFPSMGRAPDAQGGQARLVSLKAVAPGYPLYGQIEIQRGASGEGPVQAVREGPPVGAVWVDQGLLGALGLKVGDPLELGDAELRIDAVLRLEPDRGGGFSNFAPRVLMHAEDLPRTQLIQPASRVNHRLLVAAPAGREAVVSRFGAWVESQRVAQGWRGVRLETLEGGRPEMQQTLDRARLFLHLVALLTALLAAVALAIAARDFALRRLDEGAMLRVLGLAQRQIATLYALELLCVALVASALGLLMGLALQQLLVAVLGSLVGTQLPAPGWRPALLGMGVSLMLVAGFALPPMLQLAQVPALRVIRRDLGQPRAASVGVLLMGVGGFAALLLVLAQDRKLGAVVVGGFAAALGVFALAAWLAVTLLRRWVPAAGRRAWVLATRQVAARPGFAVLQVSALAVGLLALVLLVLLRTDLIASWRAATPPDAPNRFVINIQPDQAADFAARLDAAGVRGYDHYPMIRGRLVSVNGKAVSAEQYSEPRAQRLVEREFNLSHSAVLPAHNGLVGGRWVGNEPDAISIEQGLAQTLGLKLGDTLGFDISGEVKTARITSLRSVDWGSMRVNFFALYPLAEMPDAPATTIVAYRAPEGQPKLDSALTHEFPNITLVDVSATVAQVQRVLDQVVRAVEFLFAFTLAAGLVVLYAAVTATRQSREQAYALMRTMGADRRLLGRVQRLELLGVGALAGLLASVAAMGVGALLAQRVFNFTWTASPWVLLWGTLAGALLAWAAGWWGLRGVLTRPVVETLRRQNA